MKIIKSVDELVKPEDITSDNNKLTEILNKRGKEEKEFMFFGNSSHKDYKSPAHDDCGTRLIKNGHIDEKYIKHTDIRKHTETHRHKEYSDKKRYGDTYTEHH